MTVTIDAQKLRRKLGGVYGGTPSQGDHLRFYWWIGGVKYGGVKLSHSKKKKDLPDFVASDTCRKLKVTRVELKEMEGCSFTRGELERRLTR